MLFDFEQPEELLTPTINHGCGVSGVNPIMTSSDITSLDEHDMCFSSIPSKKNEYALPTKDTPNENIEQQEDLFSTFDLPVLSEFSRTELQLDAISIDPYLNSGSIVSPPMDDSNFYPAEDDSTSSSCMWVGKECTIESAESRDMAVPLSPPFSSASSPGSVSTKISSKKRHFSTVERKLRKKDQNKSAAEKYRLKKRAERTDIVARHTDLKNQNRELKFEMENLSFQLEQFKQLFVDILQIPIPSTISK